MRVNISQPVDKAAIEEWLDFYRKNLQGRTYIVKETSVVTWQRVDRGYDHLGWLGDDLVPDKTIEVENKYQINKHTAIDVARKLVEGKCRLEW